MNKQFTLQSEKLRQALNANEIAWTNKQKADLKWLWRHMFNNRRRKNIAGQVLTYNSKKFHWLNKN